MLCDIIPITICASLNFIFAYRILLAAAGE